MPLDQVDIDQYDPTTGEKEMSFLDHLEELRWHIIRSLIVAGSLGIVLFLLKSFVFNTIIFGPKNKDFITYQFFCKLSNSLGFGDQFCFTPVNFQLQAVEFGETFILHIKISFIMGLVVAFPYIFWEFWRFIKPALYEKEQKKTKGVVFICSFLFLLGISFGYFVIAPFAVNFLASYEIGGVVNQPKLSSFVGYMLMFTIPAGIVFELPIFVYFFTKLGLLTPDFLRRYRKHSIIIILLLSAIITPPDIITQFLIGIPLYVLYEISIVISERVYKKQQEALK